MTSIFQAQGLTRRFDDTVALDAVDLELRQGSVIGLVGRNGSGKSTLLNVVLGLTLPTSGSARTFGVDVAKLTSGELGRIGAVHQENRLLGWMTVEQHLRYVSSFFERWDERRERVLMDQLELEPRKRVAKLSPGQAQRLAVVLALGSRPELLLLDEPVSAMDPIAREAMLEVVLELVREDGATVVVSSHVLRDVERVVDHVLCLDRGRVVADEPLDDLLEQFSAWSVTSLNGGLPPQFDEGYVIEQRAEGRRAELVVRRGQDDLSGFAERHHAEIEARPLNLETIFPHLVGKPGRGGQQ